MNFKIILLIAFICFLQPINAQITEQDDELRRTWLKENTNPILSINPSIEDFSDLEFLKDVLKDKQVVILGEPSHGDGSVFLAKSRLIKFLHMKLGYEVLVFESGFYDVQLQSRNAKTPEEILNAANKSIFRVWSKSNEAYPTLEYVSETYNTDLPLVLEGMDIQFNGTDSLFINELENKIKGEKLMNVKDYNFFMDTLRELMKNHLYTPIVEDQELFLSLLTNLKSEWKKANNLNTKDKSFWLQMIENIRALALTPWNEDLGFRERQMADNLLWLAENKYPNKKIIVWMASVYSFKNRETINTLNPNLIYDDKDSFGDKLQQSLGNKVYNIGFTAATGKYGAFYWDSEPKEIDKPSLNSFENLFNSMDINFGFLNLEKLENSELWRNKQVTSRPLGYSEMKAVWYNIFDGLFFIKVMEPSIERK